MIVLHVVAPAQVGGLERVVHLLASGQRRRGHGVHVALVLSGREASPPAHPLAQSLANDGVAVHTVDAGDRAYLAERRQIQSLCHRLRPQVVHTHGYRPDVLDAGVARALQIPTVTTVHGFTGGDLKNRIYEMAQRRAFRRFSAVVAVSRPLAQSLARSVGRDRLHVLPNAWELRDPLLPRSAARRALGIAEEGFHLGWVGRLSSEKGAEVLIAALPLLGDLPLSVSLVGDGPERARLQERARQLGIADRVRWHGHVPDAARLFTAFDVFVISSHTEGTPIALFEAMAADVPIVATRVGGVPDVVSEREAMLVPAADPRTLASAIRDTLLDDERSRLRACAARDRLQQKFELQAWLDGYDRVYQRSLTSSTRPQRCA